MMVEPEMSPDWRARLLAEMPGSVALFDTERRYVGASAAWADTFALPPRALTGRRHDEFGTTGADMLDEVLRRALSGASVEHYAAPQIDPERPDWRPVFSARPHAGPDGRIVGAIVSLDRQHAPAGDDPGPASPDPLTGLADRHQFAAHLRQILAHPDPGHRRVTAFAINIDRFRNINNLHGIRVGDRVLRLTAERLLAGSRSHRAADPAVPRTRDLVARLGGDEFGIVCGPPALSPAQAQVFAERILRIVENPIAIGDLALRLTASLGCMMTTPAHRDENDVLRDLDLAAQRAKALGPSRIAAWEPALTDTATRRYALTDELRRAFDNGEFVLYYQPVVRLGDSRMIGAEALLRWRHPREGLLAPAAFLPVLEETGLICEVGVWAVREAVRQIEAWHALHGRDMIEWVSVNVSPRQFDDPAPLLAVLRELHAAAVPLQRLKLEITETTFMRSPENTRAVLAEIGELGIRIGIDDFGTGYSSLNALRRYPVDTIKIDAEFIAQIGTQDGDELAHALLNIARMYGAAIVAEGIETIAQRDFLRDKGCGFGQGYLFGQPMDGGLLGTHAVSAAARPDARPAPTKRAG